MKINYIIAGLCLLAAGCQNAPFAPIAVPNHLSYAKGVIQEEITDKQIEELKALHEVKYQDHIIRSGDKFNIYIEQYEKMNRKNITVLYNGTINISPIGRVKVEGLTVEELNAKLSKAYERYVKNSNVVIEITETAPYTFTILGAVQYPGSYEMSSQCDSLIEALGASRGLARSNAGNNELLFFADLKNSFIVRDGKVLPVDFIELLKGDPLHNIPLQNKDYIYLPSRESSRIMILGEFHSQTTIPYQLDLTLTQVVGMANGLKDSSDDVIKVIRGGMNHPVVFNINIQDIQNGRIMDFMLEPNDIIFAPKDGISDWNVVINKLFPTVQFLNSAAGPFGNPASMIYD